MNGNLKEKEDIIKDNINQMKELIEDIKTWDKEQLEKYLSDIILQNIMLKENILKEIKEQRTGGK